MCVCVCVCARACVRARARVSVCVKNGKKLRCLLRKTRRKTQIELHETMEHHKLDKRMEPEQGNTNWLTAMGRHGTHRYDEQLHKNE